MAYGELGPTHHSIEDIAWLRAIDNMIVVVPADPIETAAAMRWAAATDGPGVHPGQPDERAADLRRRLQFVPGKAVTVREGDDVTMISNGTVLWRALVAAEQLAAEGIAARVHLDADRQAARRRRRGRRRRARPSGIVTAEEATTAGGLGGAVAETVVAAPSRPG